MNQGIKWLYETLIVIITGGLFLTVLIQSNTIALYKSDVENLQKHITINDSNAVLALKIISTNTAWYIVSKDTISTKPDGQGIVIGLNEPIKDKGSRLGIDHAEKNKKIAFVTKGSQYFGTGYTICGGLLSYYYAVN